MLAWRPITSVDLGYHLAYGEHFLRTGRIVDDQTFLYVRPGPDQVQDVGPGNWFDSAGRYRFPNPSYVSEIVYALLHRAGGAMAINLLHAALAGGALALAAGTMRRLGVPRPAAAAALLLIELAASERFIHRPEAWGFFFLSLEMFLLAGPVGRARAAALVAVQWFFVQFHATWFLGLALTLPLLAEAAARALWARTGSKACGTVRTLAIVAGAQFAVSFLNPWTWRLAVLPVQMLLYLRSRGIYPGSGSTHPWQDIGEVQPPFDPAFAASFSTSAFAVVLAQAAAGLVAAVTRRRWAWALLLLGTALVGLRLRRNIAPAAFVLVSVAAAAVTGLVGSLAAALRARRAGQRGRDGRRGDRDARATWVVAASVAALLVTAAGAWAVASGRFYSAQRQSWRFGSGWSELGLPAAAGAMLRSLPPEARIFTTYNAGSALLWFTRDGGFRDMPILTNGWAFPPRVMAENRALIRGEQPFGPFADRYGVGAAVLDLESSTPRLRAMAPPPDTSGWLISRLAASGDWAVVGLEPRYVTFARRTGPAAEWAARQAVRRDAFDSAGLARRIAATDDQPAWPLLQAGLLLTRMGWGEHAIELWRQSAEAAALPEAHFQLGTAYAQRGTALLRRMLEAQPGDPAAADRRLAAARQDWERAQRHLRRALELRPAYAAARANLELLLSQQQALARGQVELPPGSESWGALYGVR